jgi:hypothetical protein
MRYARQLRETEQVEEGKQQVSLGTMRSQKGEVKRDSDEKKTPGRSQSGEERTSLDCCGMGGSDLSQGSKESRESETRNLSDPRETASNDNGVTAGT